MTANPADPILLELLRTRLQAVVDEGATAIEQTAVSPIVAEGKDFSTNILTPSGDLLVGGGKVEYKWPGARNVVRATIARHGDTVADGDVFAANDPHAGGGNHPQDIEVCQPVFVDGRLIGWIAASAHLIDVGGMTFGSWAPDATECFQEAIRFPPVRLFRGGVEQTDVWSIVLTNVRLPQLVEMDIRGLVAGCHVAARKLAAAVTTVGVDTYLDTVDALCDATESVLRDRIRRLADGTYSMDGWVEWADERYHLPCRLTVDGDHLVVDFTGAPPQVPHFVNSKHYIVHGQIVADVRAVIGQDLPFCEGLYRPIEVICPPGTIVDSTPPAPIGSAHLDVAMNATALAVQCLQMALAATPDPQLPRLYAGPSGQAALANHSWAYTTPAGAIDGMVLSESFQPGSSAAVGRDGSDLFANVVGAQSVLDFVDIEILEAWYPVQVEAKGVAPGAHGAGAHRSGAGCCMAYRPVDVTLRGAMFAMREALPIPGVAGGLPGAPTEFRIRRADGSEDVLESHAANVTLGPGEVFVMQAGSGGGWGDPVRRAPDAVAADVTTGRLSRSEALDVYGVVTTGDGDVDEAATEQRRAELLAGRLAAADPPPVPVAPDAGPGPDAVVAPLYHGVEQRGPWAVAVDSGAVLARAPHHWTDGCPVVVEQRRSARGVPWELRSYLDPQTGIALYVEAVPPGAGRAFGTEPRRWTGT